VWSRPALPEDEPWPDVPEIVMHGELGGVQFVNPPMHGPLGVKMTVNFPEVESGIFEVLKESQRDLAGRMRVTIILHEDESP
jgi:hypothetical protein